MNSDDPHPQIPHQRRLYWTASRPARHVLQSGLELLCCDPARGRATLSGRQARSVANRLRPNETLCWKHRSARPSLRHRANHLHAVCQIARHTQKVPRVSGKLRVTARPRNKVYRRYEDDLARAQRAGNKKRTRAIHAKIANARRHYLHVVSAKLTSENGFVAVGDVSASAIAKTGMGKSVHDAGWSAFRRMLRYKLARRQAAYVEVDERYTSQTCSVCGSLRGPRGLEGLGVRQWSCTECGTHHQRDVNSARLILMSGRSVALQQPEIPTYYGKTLKEKPQQAFNLAAGRRTR